MAGSWNSAVKCAWVGVVPGWVTPGKSSPGLQKQSREPVGQNGQYCVVVRGLLQRRPIREGNEQKEPNYLKDLIKKSYVRPSSHLHVESYVRPSSYPCKHE